VDAAGHEGLDDRTHIFLGDRPLVLFVAVVAAAIGHRLVLQVAFAALVADRAIERMVDQQELHHPLARLADAGRVGEDLLIVRGRQRAAGLGLGRPGLHLDQAHPAIAGDGQPLVIAEARDLLAGKLAGLEHRRALRHFDLDTVDLDHRHRGAGGVAKTVSAAASAKAPRIISGELTMRAPCVQRRISGSRRTACARSAAEWGAVASRASPAVASWLIMQAAAAVTSAMLAGAAAAAGAGAGAPRRPVSGPICGAAECGGSSWAEASPPRPSATIAASALSPNLLMSISQGPDRGDSMSPARLGRATG
jgi:hypothetical protein